MNQEFMTIETSDQLAASFVPAVLRREFAKKPKRKAGTPIDENFAALLWIDICAFSPLCNRIIKDSELGVETLSRILQEHYELLLNIIAEHNGEPVIFAGDGIMASWPCTADTLQYAIKSAAACAHSVLNKRSITDDLGNLLSFHVVVAGGPCEFIELGGINNKWTFTIAGDALSDISLTSKNRAPDQVLISNATLKFLDANLASLGVAHDSSILLDAPDFTPVPAGFIEMLEPEALNTLLGYVPKPIGLPVNRERLKWIAELRPVTIVFIQIPIQGLDTPGIISRLRQSVSLSTPIVNMHDGLLNQVWVDEKDANMLICFGPPPYSHVDNPNRGIKTALDIHAILNKAGFENGIGITTGQAYCGILGNDMLRQYTVIGDVVNLGARFAGLKKNQVLCDRSTYNQCQDIFEFSEIEEVAIKGNTGLVTVWQPLRSVKKDIGIQIDPVSIGRQKELFFLLDTFDKVVGGTGKLLVLQGLSGMGKSRLVQDFKICNLGSDRDVLIETTDVREKDIPYHAWRNIFASILGIDSDNIERNRANVVVQLLEKYEQRACLLNVVLQLDVEDSDEVKSLSGSQRAAATESFLLEIVNAAAGEKPIAIIIDDAQWIDEMSAKLAETVAATINSCMVICALPDAEGVPRVKFMIDHGATNISLNELDDDDLNRLICAKLGVTTIAEAISAPIRKVAKGNPFFCTQLAGSLLDQGLIIVEHGECQFAQNVNTEQLSLPETVKGVVRRRIDGLGHGAQLSLKVGSVIGQRFRTKLIQHIYPIQVEQNMVSSYLLEDKQYGLLHETVVENMDGFLFNHGITREVAYEMTLVEQRKHLHRKSAEWYELNFADNPSPFFTQLAHHWEEAGEKIKASEYYEKEAIRLFILGYPKQATDVGLKGISLFTNEIERDLEKMGMKIGENMGAIAGLMENRSIESLLDLKKLDNPNMERLLTMLTHISPFAHNSKQVELFVLMSILGLRLALENGNSNSTADVYAMYAVIYRSMTGDSATADKWSQLAIDVDANFQGSLFGRVSFVRTWFISHWVRPMKDSVPVAEVAAKAAMEAGDVLFGCFNLSGHVIYMARAGATLNAVIAKAAEQMPINQRRALNAYFHLLDETQRAKALAGRTIAYTSLTDDEFNEEKDIASICDTDFGTQIGYYFISKMMLNAHFGNWAEGVSWASKIPPLFMSFAGQPGEIDYEFFNAIVSLYRSAELNGEEALLKIADDCIAKMRGWIVFCSFNFEHKVMMLDAIRESLFGDPANATILFEGAAAKAKENGYIQEAGLAFEHLLRMQKRLGQPLTALAPCIAAYTAWGADAKVTYVRAELA